MSAIDDVAAKYAAEILADLSPAWDIPGSKPFIDPGVHGGVATLVFPGDLNVEDGIAVSSRYFPLPSGLEIAVARAVWKALVVRSTLMSHET